MAKEDCEAANVATLGKSKASKKSLLVGDSKDKWTWIPPGCSTQTLDDGGGDVYRAHWNANPNGEDTGGDYRLLCTRGTRHPAPLLGLRCIGMLLRVCLASLFDLFTRVRPS